MKTFLATLLVAVMIALGSVSVLADSPPSNVCWGQASAVFAQMGEMGEHSSSYDTPRLGLRNLARMLYNAGIIEDDSMAALGQFVAEAEGLSVEACN
jgi:hypothetical protein